MLVAVFTKNNKIVDAKSVDTITKEEMVSYLTDGCLCRVVPFEEDTTKKHDGKRAKITKLRTQRNMCRYVLRGDGIEVYHPYKGWLEKYAVRSGISLTSP